MDKNKNLYKDNEFNDDASGSDGDLPTIEGREKEPEVEELEEEEKEVRKKLLLLKILSTTSNPIIV